MNQKIKISQLPAKGSNLAAQDLIEIAEFTGTGYISKSITGQEIIDAAVGNVDWGDIGGTLSNQTDLQNALDAKQDDITLTTTGSSGASTLVGSTLNVPNYTLSGLGGVPTSRTLTINGVTQDLSADRTFTISTGITIGSTAIASGVVGRVLFEGAGNVVQESSSLFWDNTGGNLSLGTSIPSSYANLTTLTINGTNGSVIDFKSGNTLYGEIYCLVNEIRFDAIGTNGILKFLTNSVEKMRVAPTTGNVLINTTTDAGFRLDVNGTARVSSTGGQTLIVQSSLDSSFTSIAEFNASALSTSRTGFVAIGRNAATNNQASLGFFYAGNGSNANRLDFGFFGTASRMSIFAGGNIGINTTTDAGFRLDVNGTARVSGQLTVTGNIVGTALLTASQNQTLILYQRRTTVGGDAIAIDDANVGGGSSINVNILNLAGSWQTTGTCVHNNITITRAINLTSGTQTVRGFYYNPTLTNTTGLTTHYAIHTAVGRIRFENLPTSSAGLSAGELWNDAGTLKIV